MSRIVVITSCTGRKANPRAGEAVPAEALYLGEQHRRLMRGVSAFRTSPEVIAGGHALDLWILSAGHGLIRGSKKISAYESTFAGTSRPVLEARAGELGIPGSVRRVLQDRFDLALIMLGTDYVRAAAIDETLRVGGPVLAYCGAEAELILSKAPGIRPIRVRVEETRNFACGLVGVKGEIAGRLLARLGSEPEQIATVGSDGFDVLDWIAGVDPDRQMSLVA